MGDGLFSSHDCVMFIFLYISNYSRTTVAVSPFSGIKFFRCRVYFSVQIRGQKKKYHFGNQRLLHTSFISFSHKIKVKKETCFDYLRKLDRPY